MHAWRKAPVGLEGERGGSSSSSVRFDAISMTAVHFCSSTLLTFFLCLCIGGGICLLRGFPRPRNEIKGLKLYHASCFGKAVEREEEPVL